MDTAEIKAIGFLYIISCSRFKAAVKLVINLPIYFNFNILNIVVFIVILSYIQCCNTSCFDIRLGMLPVSNYFYTYMLDLLR